jgi:ATP-binding cassette, subfamily C (CFTR/MRP), member 1
MTNLEMSKLATPSKPQRSTTNPCSKPCTARLSNESGFLPFYLSYLVSENIHFGMYWFLVTLAYATDTLRTTTPLLNQVILTWLTESFVYFDLSDTERTAIPKPPGIGYGIGLAFALFVMQG